MEPTALVDACLAILRGERLPDPRFAPLIEAFADEFGIELVNVTADRTVVHEGDKGRLQLWCRTRDDDRAFRDAAGNFDRGKQARASELAGGGPWFVYSTDLSMELLRRFIGDGCRAVAPTIRELLDDERIVRMDGAFGRLVVFLETRAQAAPFRDGAEPLRVAWEDRVWAAFAEHVSSVSSDLVPRERFKLEVDSREAYVNDYQGSSYYYWL